MEGKFKYLYILIVFFAMRVNRVVTAIYGENPSNLIMLVALSVSMCALVIMIIMKKYLAVVLSLSMVLPAVVATIGIWLDNLYLASLGIVLFFVLVPIMIKLASKYIK